MGQIVFVHENVREADIELFLQPKNAEERKTFKPLTVSTVEDLMVELKKFPTKGQSKKNGWHGDIAKGFSHIVIGKNKNRTDIFILNELPIEADLVSNSMGRKVEEPSYGVGTVRWNSSHDIAVTFENVAGFKTWTVLMGLYGSAQKLKVLNKE